jgi:hypothetical protein
MKVLIEATRVKYTPPLTIKIPAYPGEPETIEMALEPCGKLRFEISFTVPLDDADQELVSSLLAEEEIEITTIGANHD